MMNNKKKVKLLIVEDEAWEVYYIQTILKGLDYEFCKPAAKGKEALQSVEQDPPDVILMDIRLAGGMDGIETTRAILKRWDIPIIFMTGYPTPDVCKQVAELKPAAFFEKPVSRGDIKAVLDDLFEKCDTDTLETV